MSQPAEMVIFTRAFDFLSWLLPSTNHFPRAHRHGFTQRLLGAAFDLRERLEEANCRQGAARQERLQQADETLARRMRPARADRASGRGVPAKMSSWFLADLLTGHEPVRSAGFGPPGRCTCPSAGGC